MNPSNNIRCAIAGLGRIGVTLQDDPLREKPASHWGAVEHHPDTILVAGADPEEDRRLSFLDRCPDCEVFEDSAVLIRDIRPDILHIAADTDSHMPLLQRALEEKVPVVICEKPLANSLEEAQALASLVESSDSRVLINHERRFSRDYRDIRKRIQNEEFGRLLSVNARLFMGRSQTPAKVLYHDGTHMLDILRFLTGNDLTLLHSQGNPHQESSQLLILARAGDSDIVLEVSGGRDHLVFEMDLSFERGRVRLGNGVYELWTSEESPYYSGFRSLKLTKQGWDGSTAYFSSMMDHGVELFRHPERTNESSFRDGLEVMKLIDGILAPYGLPPVPSSSGE